MNLLNRPPLGLKKPKQKKDAKSREHLTKVKSLPCVICNHPPPSDAHHIICDRFGSKKSSDYETIPLCKNHHQNGIDAIHNSKKRWVENYGKDYLFLPEVLRKINEI